MVQFGNIFQKIKMKNDLFKEKKLKCCLENRKTNPKNFIDSI